MNKSILPWLFLFLQCLQGAVSFAPPPTSRRAALAHRRLPSLWTSTASASPTAAEASSSSSPSSATLAFDWEHQWYPVVPLRDLYTDRPNKITLLGRDYVVWCSTTSNDGIQWNAFADVCPHRLVPLSEGRIEDNVLQCAYHGWSFNTTGSCVRIPQLESIRHESQSFLAVTSPRACATSFPVRTDQELLWIFPSSTNKSLAAQRQPTLIPQLDDPANVDATDLFTRDLPYSWEVLVENLCDPTHVSFAHHEFMNGADRYQNNQKLDLIVTQETASGFVGIKQGVSADEYSVRFEAPCLLYYSIARNTTKGESYIGIGSYCVPTAPGNCRLIARFPFRIPVAPAMFALRHTPTWITHYSQNVVLDSDVVFLTAQDQRLQSTTESDVSTSSSVPSRYYMPSQADALVRAFRKWLQLANGPTWLGIPADKTEGDATSWIRVPKSSGRDSLLDRYRQHTTICSACRKTHRNLHWLKEICLYASFGSVAWSARSRKKLTAVAALLLFLTRRVVLGPLIARLECVPWPRKRWLLSFAPKARQVANDS